METTRRRVAKPGYGNLTPLYEMQVRFPWSLDVRVRSPHAGGTSGFCPFKRRQAHVFHRSRAGGFGVDTRRSNGTGPDAFAHLRSIL